MQNYDLLLERISKYSGLEKEEIERRIEAKKAKLSGLISKEGAAQIIASELGISLENVDVKIMELMPGMKKVNVIGKIIDIFPVREFEKNNRRGKVANFILADDTGNLRVVLWDTNHIELIEKNKLKKEDFIEIKNASMREQELHLNSFSDIKKSEKVIENIITQKLFHEKLISDIRPGENVRARGIVVQMFLPRFFYVCPECGKKVSQEAEGFKCNEHGRVQAKERAILNFVIDDGSETLRTVLFSEQIEKLINEADLKNNEKLAVFREDFLGTEIWLDGNARKNQFFGNLEVIGSNVEKVDVEKLIEVLEKR